MNQFEAYKGIAPGKIISHELSKRKITQRDFSLSIGMHYQTLCNVIKGHRSLTLPQALRIEKALGLEEGFLMILQLYIDIEACKRLASPSAVSAPKLRRILFWDTDFDKLDFTKHREFIIRRVMERGNPAEKASIATFYSLPLPS